MLMFIAILCAIAIVSTLIAESIKNIRILGIILGSISLAAILYFVLSLPRYPMSLKLLTAGISIYVDHVSLLFLLNIVVIGIAALVSSYHYINIYGKRNIPYFTFLIIFLYSMIGIVLANNWLSFLILWETMTIVSYILIVYDYERQSVRNAGTLYILTCHAGTLLLTIGIVLLYIATGSLSMEKDVVFVGPLVKLAAILMFLGFATKAGLAPLHFWLPYAHPAAPSPISALLSGAMVELGAYGTYRLVSIIHSQLTSLAYIIWSMAFTSIIIALIAYWSQKDYKRLFAWSTIDHVGWIFIPLAIACINKPLINNLGIVLALYVLNHGIAKASAFLATGYMIYSYNSTEIEKISGLSRWDPLAAFIIGASIFAIEGIPPFNLFFSKISIILTCINVNLWYVGTALAILWCIAFIYYVLLFNKSCLEISDRALKIVRRATLTIYVPIIVLIIFASLSNFIAQWIIYSKRWW